MTTEHGQRKIKRFFLNFYVEMELSSVLCSDLSLLRLRPLDNKSGRFYTVSHASSNIKKQQFPLSSKKHELADNGSMNLVMEQYAQCK